jgi:VTC domain
VFLERKLRKPHLLIKRRTVAALSAMEVLQERDADRDWEGAWFHRRLLARKLRPVCQVSYRRTARVVMCTEGLARLTLDEMLRAAPADEPAFGLGRDMRFLEERMILELKYRARVPAVFRRLIEDFTLEPGSASKYRLAMAALGHAATSGAPDIQEDCTTAYA